MKIFIITIPASDQIKIIPDCGKSGSLKEKKNTVFRKIFFFEPVGRLIGNAVFFCNHKMPLFLFL